MAFGRLKKVDLQEVSLICSALQLPEGLCWHYGRGHLWGHCGNRQGGCLSDDDEDDDWGDGDDHS